MFQELEEGIDTAPVSVQRWSEEVISLTEQGDWKPRLSSKMFSS